MKECQTCDGSRHIFNTKTGKWKKCPCLSDAKRTRSYKEARLSPKASLYTWKLFAEKYKAIRSDANKSSIVEVAAGPSAAGLLMFADISTKDSCDMGKGAKILSLGDFVDSEFDRSDWCSKDDYYIEFLCLLLGYESEHKWNKHIIEKIIRTRTRYELPTLLIAEQGLGYLERSYRSALLADTVAKSVKTTVTEK